MILKGVALLAGCFLLGQLIGETFGRWLHIDANVGGVGFAMILLILSQNEFEKRGLFHKEMEEGVSFWSKMYIPIIVAMSAIQNVRVAISSGLVAILVGLIPMLICLATMPYISKLSKKEQ
jgi:malonate transporter MadL subunit